MGGCVVQPKDSRTATSLKYQLPKKKHSSSPMEYQSQANKRKSPLANVNSRDQQQSPSLQGKPSHNSYSQRASSNRIKTVREVSPKNLQPHSVTHSTIPVFPELKSKIPDILVNSQTKAVSQNLHLLTHPHPANPQTTPKIRLNNHLITPIPPANNLSFQNRNHQLRRPNSTQSPIQCPKVNNGISQNGRNSQRVFAAGNGCKGNSPRSSPQLNSLRLVDGRTQKNY